MILWSLQEIRSSSAVSFKDMGLRQKSPNIRHALPRNINDMISNLWEKSPTTPGISGEKCEASLEISQLTASIAFPLPFFQLNSREDPVGLVGQADFCGAQTPNRRLAEWTPRATLGGSLMQCGPQGFLRWIWRTHAFRTGFIWPRSFLWHIWKTIFPLPIKQ